MHNNVNRQIASIPFALFRLRTGTKCSSKSIYIVCTQWLIFSHVFPYLLIEREKNEGLTKLVIKCQVCTDTLLDVVIGSSNPWIEFFIRFVHSQQVYNAGCLHPTKRTNKLICRDNEHNLHMEWEPYAH